MKRVGIFFILAVLLFGGFVLAAQHEPSTGIGGGEK